MRTLSAFPFGIPVENCLKRVALVFSKRRVYPNHQGSKVCDQSVDVLLTASTRTTAQAAHSLKTPLRKVIATHPKQDTTARSAPPQRPNVDVKGPRSDTFRARTAKILIFFRQLSGKRGARGLTISGDFVPYLTAEHLS